MVESSGSQSVVPTQQQVAPPGNLLEHKSSPTVSLDLLNQKGVGSDSLFLNNLSSDLDACYNRGTTGLTKSHPKFFLKSHPVGQEPKNSSHFSAQKPNG